jgi:hypothetical protein
MATRIYLPSTGTPPISPAASATWNAFVGSRRRRAVLTRIGSAMSTGWTALDDSASTLNFALGQWISDPLAVQTITGTFKAYMRCSETGTAGDFKSQIIIRVLSLDGTTVRGTLYGGDTGNTLTSEWATTLTNRSFPRVALSPVTVTNVTTQANDRLCIEMGVRILNTAHPTNVTAEIIAGDDSATDLPEDETTTAANNPWIEFSHNFAFSSLVSSPRQRARTRPGALLQL